MSCFAVLHLVKVKLIRPGVGNLQPVGHMPHTSNYFAARQAPRGGMNMDEYYMNLARVVGATRNKNCNSFSACSGKKVTHHC